MAKVKTLITYQVIIFGIKYLIEAETVAEANKKINQIYKSLVK